MNLEVNNENNLNRIENTDLIYTCENFVKELLKHIIIKTKESKENAQPNVEISKFEDYSQFVKRKFENIYRFKTDIQCKELNLMDINKKDKDILIHKKKQLKKFDKIGSLPEDVLNKARLFEDVGINFRKEEWFKINQSMKRFIKDDVRTLRFWGKIFGKDKDYYIIQVEFKENKNLGAFYKKGSPDPQGLEGANKFSFFVANYLLEEWVELPVVSSVQIQLSRLFNYYFTGDLSAKVNSFVPFPGLENHLLKCTILRITHATSICPDGYLEIKTFEDSEKTYGIDLTDKVCQVKSDFTLQSSNEEMSEPEKWIHQYPFIDDKGRIIDIPADANPIPRNQSISQDKRNFLTKQLILVKILKQMSKRLSLYGILKMLEIK